jgi:hypothetical protein
VRASKYARTRAAAQQVRDQRPYAQPLIAAAGGKVQLNQGYIALQSEGHQIVFRKIQLQLIE